MNNRPVTRIVVATLLAFAAPLIRGAEKSVTELEKELALAKAKIAVFEAEAELAKKKAALQALEAPQPAAAKTAEEKKTEAAQADESETNQSFSPPTKTPPKPEIRTYTETLRDRLPNSLAWWWGVDKYGTDLLVHVGTRVLSPYTIDKSTHELKTDGTRLGGYLELLYSNTWAWQPDGAASSIAYGIDEKLAGGSQWNKSWTKGGPLENRTLLSDSDMVGVSPSRWFTDPDDTIDYTTRLSFEFANGAARSASTITGSGDFSGEIAVDAHLLQGYATNTLFTLGLGGSVGASTDREARRVHPRYFGGIVGKFGRVIQKGDGKRLALAHLGLGYAQIDNVAFDPADATRTRVLFDGPAPRYRRSRGAALEFELFYPLFKANYAYVGARLYDHTDPGQWSISLGYEFDPFEFFKGFQSSSNAAEPAGSKTAEEKKAAGSRP